MTDPRLERLLERYRVDYESGDKIALHEAILFAVWNALPIPQWAIPELEVILDLHANGQFKRGKGVVGPYEESQRQGRDRAMHSEVLHLLDFSQASWRAWVGDVPQTQDNAFREVARMFTETYRSRPDRKIFTQAMVKAAYYRVERRSSKKASSSGKDMPPIE